MADSRNLPAAPHEAARDRRLLDVAAQAYNGDAAKAANAIDIDVADLRRRMEWYGLTVDPHSRE